jgi:hypothetical protein
MALRLQIQHNILCLRQLNYYEQLVKALRPLSVRMGAAIRMGAAMINNMKFMDITIV